MTDLFANLPQAQPRKRIGYGNAMFLCDLAEGVSDAEMRIRFKRGDYPDVHRPSIAGWRALAGRETQ